MDLTVIVPARVREPHLGDCLAGILAQRFDQGRIEIIVARYGDPQGEIRLPSSQDVRLVAVDHPSPYAARNRAAAEARGTIFLFTEPGCVPEPDWAAAVTSRLSESSASICVGHVAPRRTSRLLELFSAYEAERDAWVFSHDRWPYYFGRPKNMAITRARFESHGPFAEVQRGADSKLVQKVASELSCDEIALAPDAVVRQLSIHGLPSCFRDRARHGHALEVHGSAHAAPLTREEKARILRTTRNRQNLGPVAACILVATLAGGLAAFRLGGALGNLSRRR